MKRVARSLHILWRAESMLGTIRVSALLKQVGMLAFAALVGVFGVAMLDVAAFFALLPQWGHSGAALAVALGDFVLAIVVVVLAQFVKPGADVQMLSEVRDMALEDLEAEVAGVESAFVQARKEMLDMVRHPLSALAPGVLVPLLKSVVSGLRAGKDKE
jgi:amino acid transporter